MSTQEEIAQQYELLAKHRRTLHHFLRQQANLGRDYIPPGVANGINDARSDIERIKAILRGWGVDVADEPDDKPNDEKPRWRKPIQSIAPSEMSATGPNIVTSNQSKPSVILIRKEIIITSKHIIAFGEIFLIDEIASVKIEDAGDGVAQIGGASLFFGVLIVLLSVPRLLFSFRGTPSDVPMLIVGIVLIITAATIGWKYRRYTLQITGKDKRKVKIKSKKRHI